MTTSDDNREWAVNKGIVKQCPECGNMYASYLTRCPRCERASQSNPHLTKDHSLKKTIKQGLIIRYCEKCDNIAFPEKKRSRYLVRRCRVCHRPLKGIVLSMPPGKG